MQRNVVSGTFLTELNGAKGSLLRGPLLASQLVFSNSQIDQLDQKSTSKQLCMATVTIYE